MSFYDELSDIYHEVFPVQPPAVRFLSKDLKPGDRVLDLACGIGGVAHELALLENEVIGIDLNEKMINIANSRFNQPNEQFLVGDMTQFDQDLPSNSQFRLIYCIGNSLVHLESTDRIGQFLKKIASSLNDQGELIIQIINYDRIIDQNIDSLPTIETESGAVFTRGYQLDETKRYVAFNTTLKVGEKLYENSVQLLALRSEELKEVLENAGFSTVQFYGNFKGDPFTNNSYPMIVRATRN